MNRFGTFGYCLSGLVVCRFLVFGGFEGFGFVVDFDYGCFDGLEVDGYFGCFAAGFFGWGCFFCYSGVCCYWFFSLFGGFFGLVLRSCLL